MIFTVHLEYIIVKYEELWGVCIISSDRIVNSDQTLFFVGSIYLTSAFHARITKRKAFKGYQDTSIQKKLDNVSRPSCLLFKELARESYEFEPTANKIGAMDKNQRKKRRFTNQ